MSNREKAGIHIETGEAADGATAEQFKDINEVRSLIDHGKDQGFLTFDEINESLVHEELDAEQIEEIFQMFADEGIKVVGRREYHIPVDSGARHHDAVVKELEMADEDLAAMEGLPV